MAMHLTAELRKVRHAIYFAVVSLRTMTQSVLIFRQIEISPSEEPMRI